MEETQQYATLSKEDADALVLEHKGWAESIAKSVARAWNLDWQLDGLDGAALEALIFCSRRYQPDRGVPFKGYSRKRVHEACTEGARRSRGWTRGSGSKKRTERLAREVSAELFNLFPSLRSGQLPLMDEGGEDSSKGARIAIQQLLVGASVIATQQGMNAAEPDEIMDYKKMVHYMTALEPIHQMLLWLLYWEGESLRGIAGIWETDELNVIREHKVLLEYLQKSIQKGKANPPPRVRPGLREISFKLGKESPVGKFTALLEERT